MLGEELGDDGIRSRMGRLSITHDGRDAIRFPSSEMVGRPLAWDKAAHALHSTAGEGVRVTGNVKIRNYGAQAVCVAM